MRLKSDLSSEKLFCVFPHSLMSFIDGVESDTENASNNDASTIEDTLFRDEKGRIEDELENLQKILEDDKIEEARKKHSCRARLYKIDDSNCVLMMQIESYASRGASLCGFLPLEFRAKKGER